MVKTEDIERFYSLWEATNTGGPLISGYSNYYANFVGFVLTQFGKKVAVESLRKSFSARTQYYKKLAMLDILTDMTNAYLKRK